MFRAQRLGYRYISHNDYLCNRIDILGGANNPSWNLLYPHFSTDKRAKVMTYGCKHNREKVFKPNHLRTLAKRDLCSYPSILISDISTRSFTWRIINFYNDVEDSSAINSLLSLDIDPTIPTLLAGDFNSYGMTWYDMFEGPNPTSLQRRTGARIEAWASPKASPYSLLQGSPRAGGRMDRETASVTFSSDFGPSPFLSVLSSFIAIYFPLSYADYIGLPRSFLLSPITPISDRPLSYPVALCLSPYQWLFPYLPVQYIGSQSGGTVGLGLRPLCLVTLLA